MVRRKLFHILFIIILAFFSTECTKPLADVRMGIRMEESDLGKHSSSSIDLDKYLRTSLGAETEKLERVDLGESGPELRKYKGLRKRPSSNMTMDKLFKRLLFGRRAIFRKKETVGGFDKICWNCQRKKKSFASFRWRPEEGELGFL